MLNFSDIAYAKFLQTAPELSSMILTFREVTDDLADQSDIQVGLFILRSGDDVIFVPVVSKGDGVYPIDSVFINSKAKFFPLTRETVQSILSSQKQSLGKPKKIPETVDQNPSVYTLIQPPRTGKYTYASASRLMEFLGSLPKSLKETVFEKFASDSEVYNKLHKMFGLENLMGILKTAETTSGPRAREIGVRIITQGDDLPTPQINSILSVGYAIDGKHPVSRMAVPTQFAADGRFTTLGTLDTGYDYEVVLKTGETRMAFSPNKKLVEGIPAEKCKTQFILFANGDYALAEGVVIAGSPKEGNSVIKSLFDYKPPVMLKNVTVGDTFAVFDPNMGLIGMFEARKVSMTFEGCSIEAYDRQRFRTITLQGIRGYTKTPVSTGEEIFVPMTSLVVLLGDNISYDLETGIQAASRRKDLIEWAMMNSVMNLTFDDVEFSINGSPIGKQAQVMEALVIKEGIEPSVAENFIKRAETDKRVVIYLSKQADFEPGQIPQFGEMPPKQINPWGTQGDKLPMNSLKQSVNTGDSQTVESAIISELLQSPDMQEYVEEYLPDVEEAIDRLGRILFLSRIHINKLGEGTDTDEVFAFLSLLKNVYKMLGINYIKLQQLVGTAAKK